jgi:polyribonucleotide nucleotidyltransferase
VQCVATVFSADMVNAHDILCINAVSAALTISPLPFMGPIGAVRMSLLEGQLVVNPTLQEAEDADLDLIVVGTKDGLTMVEAGANEVPEDKLLEALEVAHREIIKLCDAQNELRSKMGKPSGSTRQRPSGSSRSTATTSGLASSSRASAKRLHRREILVKEVGPASETVTQEHVSKELQVRMSLAAILEKQRAVAVETAVREQFESDLKGLTDAEQDSKELKSAKRSLLFERIVETVELPFPVGPATVDGEPVVKDSLTKSYVKKACEAIYKSLVRQKIAVQKIRPDGRTATQIRQIEVEVGVMPRTHGSGLFTRGQTQIMSPLTLGTAKEGPADRRPLARAGPPVHAPLQLPALLGG